MSSNKLSGAGRFESWFRRPQASRNQRLLTAIIIVAVIALAAILTKFTMFKWGDPITDLGVELAVADKLSQGQVLYRDLTYPYGPFSPYLNSVLLKVFGNEISSVLVGSVVSVLIGGLLVFRLSLHFAPAPLAAVTIVPFLLESVFGHYYINGTFGFVLPYAFPAVHAILFGMAAVDLYINFMKERRWALLLWSGVCAGLASLCKLEIAAATIIAVLVGILFLHRTSGRSESSVRVATAFLLPALATTLLGFLPFLLLVSPEVVISQNVLKPAMADPTKNIFQLTILGMDQPLANVKTALRSLGFWLVFCPVSWIGATILGFGAKGSTLSRIVWGIAGAVPAAAFTWFGIERMGPFVVLKGLPLLLIIVLGLVAYRSVRRNRLETSELAFGVMALFSLLCLARILLNVGMFHYGFFMALPALVFLPIVVSYLTFSVFKSAENATYYVRGIAFAVVLAMSVGAFAKSSVPAWNMKETTIEGPGGVIKAIPTALNQYLAAGMEYMDGVMDKDGSLVVIPEGAMLNLLFRRENPTRYGSFTPHIVAGLEHEVAEEFREKRPDYVLLIDRKLDEFGSAGPGKDYLLELMGEVDSAYDTLAATGPVPYTHDQGGWVLFRRR